MAAGAALGSFMPGAGNVAGAIVGLIAGVGYYTLTEVVTFNGKSAIEWAKEGAGWVGDQVAEGWNKFTSWLGF